MGGVCPENGMQVSLGTQGAVLSPWKGGVCVTGMVCGSWDGDVAEAEDRGDFRRYYGMANK